MYHIYIYNTYIDIYNIFVDYLLLYNNKGNGTKRWLFTFEPFVSEVIGYYHHNENYEIALQEGVVPAFLPASDGFQQKRYSILFNVGRNLVELLMIE